MAVTDNDKVVTIPDGLEEGSVLCFDITDNKFIDSGVKAKNGSLFTDTDGLNLGNHQVYASGENIIFRNKSDNRSYYPAWREIDPTGATVSKMTARLYGFPLQPIVRFTDINSVVKNPNFEINVTGDEAVFQLQYVFIQAYTDVVFEILRKDNGQQIWKAITPHVEAGVQKIQLEVPFELKKGDYFFKVYLADETLSPIELRGDEHGNPAYTLFMRPWTDENLATETFVLNEISGGHQAAYLDKATYDPDNDGSVVLADKIKGADAAPNDHYYGKNGSGNVGFFPVPSGGPVDSDVMLKSVYDTNNDGVVDVAKAIADASSADADTYYGKDEQGNIGFLAFPQGVDENNSKILVKEFTSSLTLDESDLIGESVSCFVFKGDKGTRITLPAISTLSEDVTFHVANHGTSTTQRTVTLFLDDKDGWNGNSAVTLIKIGDDAGLTIVSDRAEKSWYAVSSLDTGYIATMNKDIEANTTAIASHTVVITKNTRDITTHEVAIEGHGSQLASHSRLIQANAAFMNAQMKPQINRNLSSIEALGRTAINGIVPELNVASRTITLKLTSESGTVDTALIDLSPLFGGGTTDHVFYYGFSLDTTVDERVILKGTRQTAPNIGGVDIHIERSSQSPQYMWVWLPDTAGTIKGFSFSGFVSVWPEVQLSVGGTPGKVYVSPNSTSASSVDFEVTV